MLIHFSKCFSMKFHCVVDSLLVFLYSPNVGSVIHIADPRSIPGSVAKKLVVGKTILSKFR